MLIHGSYNIYIRQNKAELTEINNILAQKNGDIDIRHDEIIDKSGLLTADEREQLRTLRDKVNSYWISKSEEKIYYGLYGFLDIRIGVSYNLDSTRTLERFTLLPDNWYY